MTARSAPCRLQSLAMEQAQPAKVLTIAGSDSGGAAGLQADLKTFTALGVYGMSVVTAVTAQNSVRVEALQFMPEDLVAAQIEAVLTDYGAAAIKTGFLGQVGVIEAVAAALASHGAGLTPLVVDPVLVNHRGEVMFSDEVVGAYRGTLLPGCALVTPNVREAALLCEQPLETWTDVERAAFRLRDMGASAALISGVWREGAYGDALCEGRKVIFLETRRVETAHTHGSGDTLSAAIAAFLAQGLTLRKAVRRARAFTGAAIHGAATWQMGAGHGPLNHMAPWPVTKED